MISNTKIKERIARKRSPDVVQTLKISKENKSWSKVAKFLSGSRKKYSSVNLSEIDAKTTEGDTVVILGKVLGSGNLNKKIRVCALQFSDSALEKLKENKSEVVFLKDEIAKNPKAEGLKVLGVRK